MNNFFLERKRTASTQNTTPRKKKKILNNTFIDRRQEFLRSLSPALANCLLNGLYPTIKEPKEDAKPISLLQYNNNKERIQYLVDDFSQSHLSRELYKNGVKDLKLRERIISLEGPIWSYDYKPKLRKDEAESNFRYNRSVVDSSGKDMSMVYFPEWKSDEKEKWKSQRGFIGTVYPRPAEPTLTSDVYIEGFEILGDLQRRYDKPIGRQDFKCSIKSSIEPLVSTSLRKGKHDQTFIQITKTCQNSECSTNATRYPKIYSKSIRQELEQIAKKNKSIN